jgi:hypothetical protein
MKNNKALTLIKRGKTSYFSFHRRFLPIDHKLRKKKEFFVGRVGRDVAPPLILGEELYDMVSEYGDIVFDFQSNKWKFLGFGLTYNWIKQSIF